MGKKWEDMGYLLDIVRRLPVLTALRDSTRTRTELTDQLDASKTTVHRATTTLEDHGLVEQHGREYRLTPIGQAVAEDACAFHERTTAARELEPLFDAVTDAPVPLDPRQFANATVTTAEPGDPYAPVRQFKSLLREADRVRWLDCSTIVPTDHGEMADCIDAGLTGEVIFETGTVRQLRHRNPDLIEGFLAHDELSVLVCEELPFGLTTTNERVGVGGYDPDTGVLRVYAVTTDDAAVAWSEDVFEHFREAADPLEETPLVAE